MTLLARGDDDINYKISCCVDFRYIESFYAVDNGNQNLVFTLIRIQDGWTMICRGFNILDFKNLLSQ